MQNNVRPNMICLSVVYSERQREPSTIYLASAAINAQWNMYNLFILFQRVLYSLLCASVALNECLLNGCVIPPAELLADSTLLITLQDRV